MQILKYSASLSVLLFFCFQSAFAQQEYFPTSVRIGTDVVAIGQTLLGTDKTKYEVNADIDLHHYFLAVDIGIDNIKRKDESFIYNNKGRYFRVGADYNFLANDPEDNVFFVGLRYARSTFNDNLLVNTIDDIYGAYTTYNENKDLTARWFELATGVKVRVWNDLFIGYTLRLKFSNKIKGAGSLSPYEVPGYGEAEDDTEVGVNYQIFYRLPFSKSKSKVK